MLEACGMEAVEREVLQALYARAGPLKLMAIVDDAHRMLSQVSPCYKPVRKPSRLCPTSS